MITPVWFRRAVAGILRDVIKAPPGIQHLITLFVGGKCEQCLPVCFFFN